MPRDNDLLKHSKPHPTVGFFMGVHSGWGRSMLG